MNNEKMKVAKIKIAVPDAKGGVQQGFKFVLARPDKMFQDAEEQAKELFKDTQPQPKIVGIDEMCEVEMLKYRISERMDKEEKS